MRYNFRTICIIAEGYPTENDPVYTFIDQLCVEFVDMGIKTCVIAPQSLTKSILRRKPLNPRLRTKLTINGNKILIYQPYYLTFSNLRIFKRIKQKFFEKSVLKTVKKNHILPDIFYGHFWNCGLVAAKLAEVLNKTAFVASGESNITIFNDYSSKEIFSRLRNIKGVISVSKENRLNNIKLELVKPSNIQVFINAYNANNFFNYSMENARRKLGFRMDNFIISYVGSFNHRKGIIRLNESIKKIDDGSIKSIYIGEGELKPTGNWILHMGRVPNNELVHYLNASDIFVLPTIAEGCSNAIIEALACGLPVVSSDLPFNKDILDERNAILVNPNSIDEIASAILTLKENKSLRKKMSFNSQNMVKELGIDIRAEKILNFISSKLVE